MHLALLALLSLYVIDNFAWAMLVTTQLFTDFLQHTYRRVERDMGGYRKLDEDKIVALCALYMRYCPPLPLRRVT